MTESIDQAAMAPIMPELEPYTVRTEKTHLVTMPDGVRLSMDLFFLKMVMARLVLWSSAHPTKRVGRTFSAMRWEFRYLNSSPVMEMFLLARTLDKNLD